MIFRRWRREGTLARRAGGAELEADGGVWTAIPSSALFLGAGLGSVGGLRERLAIARLLSFSAESFNARSRDGTERLGMSVRSCWRNSGRMRLNGMSRVVRLEEERRDDGILFLFYVPCAKKGAINAQSLP